MDRKKRAVASNGFEASSEEEEENNDELDLSEEFDGDDSSTTNYGTTDDDWNPFESEESAEELRSALDSPLKTGKSQAKGEGGPSTSRAMNSSSQSKKRVRNTQDDFDFDDGCEEFEGVKPVDLDAQLMTKLGMNSLLNDTELMATALTLLPKDKIHSYPKDQMDLDYFEQITKWFKSTITLDNKKMYCDLKRRPPIMTSLALQIQRQSAICRRDYVLIFITVLRAIGIQCRMVQPLNCEPCMPSMKMPEDRPKGSSNGTSELHQPRSRSPGAIKMTPRVRFAEVDSPNSPSSMRHLVTSKSCLKATSVAESAKDKLQVFSPRRLRSVSRSSNEEAGGSGNSKATKKNEEAKSSKKVALVKEKDTLQVFSPRRLRSTSQSSNEGAPKNGETSKKPNLKILQMAPERKRPATSSQEAAVPKKVKATSASAGVKAAPKSAGTKRSTENGAESAVEAPKKKSKPTHDMDLDYEGDTDESAKLFRDTTKKPKKAQPKAAADEIDRRVLSLDAVTETTRKSKSIDIWAEAYSEKDARWIAIDVMRGKVDCVEEIVKAATSPMVFVFAWKHDGELEDVSARYCTNLITPSVRQMRMNILFAAPKPTSIAQFENHPLYALKRHLLKNETIYPAEPPIIGYFREEAIYPRDCVFVLHTRETWYKKARVVKLNEQPYKMTTTIKWDEANELVLKDVPQELFGIWQTIDFEPPVTEILSRQSRVCGNWKKLIKGLLIRQRLN